MKVTLAATSLALMASLSAYYTPTEAFVLSSTATRTSVSRPVLSSSVLHVGATMDWNGEHIDEGFLMARAEACATSDSCSLEEAQIALDDVIHVQSGCVSGTVLGNVCENVDVAAETVANLRQKIQIKTRQAIALSTGVNLVAVSATMITLAFLASGLNALPVDATPFTPQEWWWAVRDGYLPQMMTEYFRHGGLGVLADTSSTVTASFDSETTPFTLQEWWWAAKGGYLNTMVDHFVRNGGLLTSENYVPDAISLTPQEWFTAAQGGFFDDIMTHHFRNGGLASISSPLSNDIYNLNAIQSTPEELFLATRDGYLDTFVKHVARNGGV